MELTDSLRQKYTTLWNTMVIDTTVSLSADNTVKKILQNRERYESVSKTSGIPWEIIACIHNMEGSLNFNTHLHNGDSLVNRTSHVPSGRPKKGNPPFTWEESAADALTDHPGKDWSLSGKLFYLESYNGQGYLKYHPEVNSPYLWAGTNQYKKGKYASDGKFDPNLVSKQIGAAVILKKLESSFSSNIIENVTGNSVNSFTNVISNILKAFLKK